MTNPIRDALNKADCAICLCEGECFETRHGMMQGPCEKLTGKAANAIAAFLRAFHANGSTAIAEGNLPWLADYVLAAAKDQTND
jgi:hypothetical protein